MMRVYTRRSTTTDVTAVSIHMMAMAMGAWPPIAITVAGVCQICRLEKGVGASDGRCWDEDVINET